MAAAAGDRRRRPQFPGAAPAALKELADPPHNLVGGRWWNASPTGRRTCRSRAPRAGGTSWSSPRAATAFASISATTSPTKRLCRRRAEVHLSATFAGLSRLPYAAAIARARPIGPFNSFSNEDHSVDDPTAPGVVLVGDAAGHNDPILGQGLSIAVRDVRLVSEAILAAAANRRRSGPTSRNGASACGGCGSPRH